MEGVGAHAAAGQLGVDVGAAGLGVLELFEHQAAGALADDEAVAAGVEGPRGALSGSSLRGAEGARGGEARHADRADGRLAAAGEHDVGVAVADEARGVADRVRAGGAGRAGGAQRALRPQLERHVRRAHVGDHHGDQQRVGAVGALVEELVGLDVQRLQAADAARHDRPDPLRLGAGVEVRVGGRVLGRRDRVAAEEVEPAHLALVDVVLGVEVLDLGGDVHLVVRGVEAGDLADARLAGHEATPEGVHVVAERRDDAETGDDDSALLCHLPSVRSPGRRRPAARRR